MMINNICVTLLTCLVYLSYFLCFIFMFLFIFSHKNKSMEPFYCNYGLNPDFRPLLEARGLGVSGLGEDGLVRVLELREHPFFFGTLYVPQARSRPGDPHPLVAALAEAAREHARMAMSRGGSR